MARLPYVIPYDPEFLGGGFRVPLPNPQCTGALYRTGDVIDYIHFSVVLHQDRRMALYTAHNIDVSQRQSVPRTSWDLDPRVEHSVQTGPSAYANNPFDRGHLVRRAAVAWGSHERAKDASDSTFYYTNASPQHEKFNQDEWLALEDWVLQRAGSESPRLCVFTGPIYTLRDTFNDNLRIPSAFWKIVVLRDPADNGNDLAALGFMMKQNELWHDWNGADTLDLHVYQVGIKEIGRYAGLGFGELTAIDEFEWRQVRFRDRSRMKPVPIEKPEDIHFFGDRRRERGLRVPRIGPPDESAPATAKAVPTVKHQCGCPDTGTVEDSVESLKRQVTVLREMVDAFLDEDKEQNEQERTATRQEAREAWKRIVGGQMVGSGEFPHCACIGGNTPGGLRWFCSGVLVHPRVVLTAAHCAPSIDQVYLGGRTINLIGVRGEVINVERVIVHPDYDTDRVPSHDIAVLLLEKNAATLPAQIATTANVEADDNVTLVGFGYEHPLLDVGFGTKRKVDVPMTSVEGFSENQIDALEETHGFDNRYELHAGRKFLGKDSCNGDSGGPAYVVDGGEPKLAAITSRASFSSLSRCGDGGIYTRVIPYLRWLHQVTDGLIGEGGGEAVTPGPQAFLYISAALPNPAGADTGNEWVEVTNVGNEAVCLTGLSLMDKQGGSHPLEGAISSGGTFKVILPSDSPLKLSNRGDEIALLRGETELHRVAYDRAGSGEILRFEPPQRPDGGGTGDGEEPPLIDADPC